MHKQISWNGFWSPFSDFGATIVLFFALLEQIPKLISEHLTANVIKKTHRSCGNNFLVYI